MGSKRTSVAYRYGKVLRQMLSEGKVLVCSLCNQRIYKADNLSVDHVVPIALGGIDRRSNMRATHLECNQTAGRELAIALAHNPITEKE